MAQSEEPFRWGKREPITAEGLTRRFLALHLRAAALEELKVSYEEVLRTVSDRVLQRSEDVIAGLRGQLAQITQLEWLTALSTTSLTLVEGEVRSLVVLADQRALFAPGPYAILTRTTTPDDYAIIRPMAYDRTLGQLDFEVVTAVGRPGPFADWQVAAVAGSTLAQLSLLGVGKVARDLAVAARDRAETAAGAADADAAAAALDRTQTGLDRIATGNDRAATLVLRNQAVEAAGTVDTSKFLQLDGLRQLTGKLLLAASAAGRAAFNMPTGSDPSAPAEGDVWYAGNGILRAFVAGAVHRLSFLGLAQSWGAVQTFLSGVVLTPVSADPASPVEGQHWTRTGLGFFGYINGASRRILDASMKASTAQAQAGTDDVAFMTPAATVAAIQANGTAEIAAITRNVRELQLFAWSDRQNIVNGIVDPLSDLSDINASASASYAQANGVISPQVAYGPNTATTGGAIGSGNSPSAAFDGNTSSLWMSAVGGTGNIGVSYIGQDFGGTPREIGQMVITNGTNGGDTMPSVLLQYSDNMSAWTTAATLSVSTASAGSTTLTVPAGTGAHRGWRLLANASSAGGSSNGWSVAELTMQPRLPPTMTVQSVAFPLSLSSPAVGRMAVQFPASAPAFTINTDFTAYLSRDGGTTFTAVPLSLALTQADGSTIYDGSANLAGQPTGSSLVWKITSPSSKGIPFTGVIAEMRAS